MVSLSSPMSCCCLVWRLFFFSFSGFQIYHFSSLEVKRSHQCWFWRSAFCLRNTRPRFEFKSSMSRSRAPFIKDFSSSFCLKKIRVAVCANTMDDTWLCFDEGIRQCGLKLSASLFPCATSDTKDGVIVKCTEVHNRWNGCQALTVEWELDWVSDILWCHLFSMGDITGLKFRRATFFAIRTLPRWIQTTVFGLGHHFYGNHSCSSGVSLLEGHTPTTRKREILSVRFFKRSTWDHILLLKLLIGQFKAWITCTTEKTC